uniref:Proteoglycan 4-like n=1 Tax=Panagrellus redivivus TaxID=6233 RepID=A0A7E4US43_PANRE
MLTYYLHAGRCRSTLEEGRYHTPKNCSPVSPDQVVRHTWHVKEGWEFKPKNQPRLASVTAVTAEKLQEIKDSLKPGYKRPTKQPTSVESVPVQVDVEVPGVEKSPSPIHVPIEETVPVAAPKPKEEVQLAVEEAPKPVDPPMTGSTIKASVTV